MGRMVGFASVFTNITTRRALPEVASIHTVEMIAINIALKEIHKRKDKRRVINTGSQSSIKSVEYNKENQTILNLIYNMLAELQAQDKKIKIKKFPQHY